MMTEDKTIDPQISYTNSSLSSSSSSLVKLDELSSFGATKQNRLPTLIKLNSMPNFSVDQLEKRVPEVHQASLPAQVLMNAEEEVKDKENVNVDDFDMLDMVGPSLPPKTSENQVSKSQDLDKEISTQYPSHLGDSLIEVVINLRNENQNLVRALETNNEYVKERLEEFKKTQEESKRREAQFALEKAEHEHQARKLQRQNTVLSERLKSMEAKLRDMNLEVKESLNAANSSQASSVNLYPQLGQPESFSNSALNQATTMQLDAASGELLNNEVSSDSSSDCEQPDEPTAPPMDTETAKSVTNMTKEELSKRFDADKSQFYAMDDPMKQCDQLERQLNDIGKRDYEICLLQQQLNIYRQDFRLERMEKLEAKIQIEKLKNDIDRLCLDRIQETSPKGRSRGEDHSHRHRSSGGTRFEPAVAAAEAVIGKLGHQLSRRAAKSAAKAAKYAAKQAHREEKAAAYAAATAAAGASTSASGPSGATGAEHHGHHRHRHHQRPMRALRNEVVNDLLSTANKAMLTGYKMASTHVNLALDKLSAFEQAQAANLANNKPQAPPSGGKHQNYGVDQPSMD